MFLKYLYRLHFLRFIIIFFQLVCLKINFFGCQWSSVRIFLLSNNFAADDQLYCTFLVHRFILLLQNNNSYVNLTHS